MEKIKSIVEWVYTHAMKTPEKQCISSTDGKYTYLEFWEKIKRNAFVLRKNGIQKEDKVLLEGVSTATYFSILLAIQLLGAIAVPVEKNIKQARIDEISKEMNPKLVLREKDFSSLLVSRETQEEIQEWKVVFPDVDLVQEILYTSGTTGKPKGVMITHRMQAGISQNANDTIWYPDSTVWFIATPTNHGGALRRAYMAFQKGASVVVHDGFKDIKSIFHMIEEYKATALFLPPSVIHFMILMCREKLQALDGQLDFIYSSGSMLLESDKKELNKILPSVRKYDVYSSTEAGDIGFIRYDTLLDNVENKKAFTLFPKVKLSIIDSRLAIESPHLMKGYFGIAETIGKKVFISSDIGVCRDKTHFILTGRADDVCNINGLKVSCSEVEDKAEQWQGVQEACCVFKNKNEFSKYLELYIVEKDSSVVDKKALALYLLEQLETYKVPKNIYIVAEIPKTANGKILKSEL